MTKEAVKEVILSYFNDPFIVSGRKRLKALDGHITNREYYTGVTIAYIRSYLFNNEVSFNIIAEVLTEMLRNKKVNCLFCHDVGDLVYEIKGSTSHNGYDLFNSDHYDRYNVKISRYETKTIEIPAFMEAEFVNLIENKINNLPNGREKKMLQLMLKLFAVEIDEPINESA